MSNSLQISGPRWGKIWLTAKAAAERAAGKSTLALRANEFLTPAAQDYATSRNLIVTRGPAATEGASLALFAGMSPENDQPHARAHIHVAQPPSAVRPLAAVVGTMGIILVRADRSAEGALASLARSGVSMKDCRRQSCWMANTIEMGEAVAAGELAGGVLLDKYAAAGMALAGKISGVRPVQGVSPAAVQAGLRQFDANFLVLGFAGLSVFEIQAMVRAFAAGRFRPPQTTPLLERLKQLE